MAERNDLTAKTEAAPAAAGDGHAGEEVAGQSFFSLVATQFLGAFNDNVFRQLILLVAVDLSIEADGKFYQPLAGALFALPFVLLSGFAGSLADRFSKTSIIRFCKGWEILVMLLGGAAFYIGNVPLLFFCLFLMGAQSAFFGPGKYGIIPELIPSRSLSKANGIILMTTYLAIILGIASAGLLKDGLEGDGGLYKSQGVLVLLAFLGTLTAFGIRRMPVADPDLDLRGKIFGDLRSTLRDIFSDRSFSSVVLTYSYFWGLGNALVMMCNDYGKILMKLGDAGTSLLFAIVAMGIAVGAIGGGYFSRGRVDFSIYRRGFCLLVASLVALTWTHQSLFATYVAMGLLGLAGGLFALPLQTSVQLWPEKNMRGRVVGATNFLCFVFMFVSSGVYFGLSSLLAPEWIPLSLGALTLLVHLLARRGLARAAENLS